MLDSGSMFEKLPFHLLGKIEYEKQIRRQIQTLVKS